MEGGKLIRAHDEVQLRSRILQLQRLQRIDRKGRARSVHFSRVNAGACQTSKCEPGHGQAMCRLTQAPAFVPSLPGRNNQQPVKHKLLKGRLRQRHVRIVRGIERPPKHPDALI